jgi:hypothetical protein
MTRIRPVLVLAFAAIALLSLGGVAQAAKKAKKNSVVTKSIKNNAVTGAKIKDGALALGDFSADALASLQTASAFDEKTNDLAVDESPGTTVLSTSITIPAPKTVTATASINAHGAGLNQGLFCTLDIAGEKGPQYGRVNLSAVTQGYAMTLNRSKVLPAGTHTVNVVCFEGLGDNSHVDARNLSVVATG